jgi:predicted AlkP superfamily phosphohydrolase/phosphomutase
MVVVVAVAEGADLDLLQSERGRVRAPWLSNVLAHEPWWRTPCGPAPYEPSNLATAFTGKGRGHHGCYSYWHIRSDDPGPPRVLTSDDVLLPWLWNWPELSQLRIATANVQLTHPPKPLNGVTLSYLMEQTLRYTYPPSFVHEMKRRHLRYGHDVSVFYRGEPPETYFDNILKVASYQLETALTIGREHDLLIVNLTIVDRLSHFLWHELESGSVAEDPAVLRGYAFLDKALAALDALAEPEPMLVLSEIGFGPIERFESLDRALACGGFLKMAPGGEIIPSGTRAREAVQGSHGIVLSGSNGSLAKLRDEVIDCLIEARADDGRRLVSCAIPREELYEGPAISLAPDIIVTPADPRRPPAGDPRWARHVNRHLQTGWHRDQGFVAVRRARPMMAPSNPAYLESIAPTVAALAGREPPAWCFPALARR